VAALTGTTHTVGVQDIDKNAAGAQPVAAGSIRSEREFMDALRALKARTGLSYRDITLRMSRMAPQDAVAKSTLASLFAQDSLPRRPGQLTALVEVLVSELGEPAEVTSRYLEDWSRLVAARSGAPAGPAESAMPQRQPEPATQTPAAPAPRPEPGGYRSPVYPQAEYWRPRYQAPAPVDPPVASRSELAGQFLKWVALLSAAAFVTWDIAPVGSFWLVWIMYCGPVLLIGPFVLIRGSRPRQSGVPELPAEYLRAEYRGQSTPGGWN
jgi:hypothetical protein